jgi:hypothetical protein
MVGTRVLLVATSGAVVAAFAGGFAIDGAVQAGTVSDDWLGIVGVVVGVGTIAAVAVSFIHATRLRRDGVKWGVAALLFPWAAPLVLAAVGSERGSVISGGTLVSALAGKWVCGCGVVRAERLDGGLCPDCGRQQLRFHRAATSQTCMSCGALLSDAEISTEDTFDEVFESKGFHCDRCSGQLCLSCMPRDAAGASAFRCSCGGDVAIRI